ncbi:MAG: TonB-dependent receptor [Proteobacteria bacterium]|nr:TonB-dependent receptor [Pseudomonadota bacterium]MBU1717154.1 TonB-dependent receptor [Pseudomonadota bacterium]
MRGFILRGLLIAILVQAVFLAAAYNQVSAATANENGESLGLYFSDKELVETATHSPKPITRVPENVTIITAEEIAVMKAQSVADVLSRVAGVFYVSNGHDFGSQGVPGIQGADYEHTLVLLDGIRWNTVNGSYIYTVDIPVSIIKRIEIIKGASSSTWGSAMGGVINIITKEGQQAKRPVAGTIAVGLAEHDTEFYDAQLQGGLGKLSYYLYGGSQDSGGMRDDRYFDRNSLYGKFNLDLPGSSLLTATIGYSDPRQKLFDLVGDDLSFQSLLRTFFYTANLELPISEQFSLNFSFYERQQDSEQSIHYLSSAALDHNDISDSQQRGGSGRLVWIGAANTLVLGAEIERNELDISADDGASLSYTPMVSEENWALYLNDTFSWQQLTVVPGIRYDHNSVTDDMVNPSLGLLYQLRDDTIVRATVARGYRRPTATQVVLYYPTLQAEKVWSYQAGIETAALKIGRLKTALFYHQAEESWQFDETLGEYVNGGDKERLGLELEFESVPVYDLSVKAGYSIVRTTSEEITSREDMYEIKLGLVYDQPRWLRAEIFGTYVYWNQMFSAEINNGSYDDFIWDLTLAKDFTLSETTTLESYFKVHNMFNGVEYWDDYFQNTERWVEGGLKLRF